MNREEFKNMFAAASKGMDFALTEQIVSYLFERFDREQKGYVTYADL